VYELRKEKIRGQSIFEAVGVERASNIKHRSASPKFVRRVDYSEKAEVGVVEAPHHSSTAKYLRGAKQKIEVSKSTALVFFTDCLAHALSVSNVIKELPSIVEAIFISLLDEHILLQVMFNQEFIRVSSIYVLLYASSGEFLCVYMLMKISLSVSIR